MKKLLLLAALAAALLVGGIVGTRVWRARVVAKVEERAFLQAGKLLREGKSLDALAVIDEQPRKDVRFAWSKLELEALVGSRHVTRVASIYGRAPERVLGNEEGSLLVARAFLAAHQPGDFLKVRTAWQGREIHPEWWLALDSDVLGFEGKVAQAERLLRSRTFVGEGEATRLVRLALHAAPRNLAESWELLDRAFRVSPRNPEIRSFRAQILESIGKSAEARVEYVAAVVADPRNPLLRDELAEFYRRQGKYDLALDTWREALHQPAPDFIALKEAFWSRIIQPAAAPAHQDVPGTMGPLVAFIRALPADRFWDAEGFARLAQNERFVRERPEVYWLQLLELMRTGKDTEAAEKITANRFRKRSWRPELETALARVLQFRTRRSLHVAGLVSTGANTNLHPFLKELEASARAESITHKPTATNNALAMYLTGPNAFAGALLTVGWRQAALTINGPTAGTNTPAWFTYGLAQSLRFNRGNAAALEFLSRQRTDSEVVLLRGELLLAEKRVAEAKTTLQTIAEADSEADSEAGSRAAWLLAQLAFDGRESAGVERIVARQPRLSSSTLGRELLARSALQSGKVAQAERLYVSLSTNSIEAQTYLAKRAFAQGNWAEARRHTEALQRRMPDELQLRENLAAIAKAERSHEKR